MTDCSCGSCVDLSVISNSIPSELEILLDIAKRQAEIKSY